MFHLQALTIVFKFISENHSGVPLYKIEKRKPYIKLSYNLKKMTPVDASRMKSSNQDRHWQNGLELGTGDSIRARKLGIGQNHQTLAALENTRQSLVTAFETYQA